MVSFQAAMLFWFNKPLLLLLVVVVVVVVVYVPHTSQILRFGSMNISSDMCILTRADPNLGSTAKYFCYGCNKKTITYHV